MCCVLFVFFCLPLVSCVSNGLSILDRPFGFLWRCTVARINHHKKRTTYVIYKDTQYSIYLKNVKQQIFGSWYGRHSIGQPFNILIDRRNRMCSGSWSLSIGINISIKSSLPTANSSTLFLHVTVAVLLDPCIRASSYRTNCAY